MNLTYRPATLADLEQCLPLIRNGFAFAPNERPELLALWRQLLADGMAESAVIVDLERAADRPIVGFGMSVFVTDAFAREAATLLPPFVAYTAFCQWQQGNSPFLTAGQIRRANSGAGLRGLILHNGWGHGAKADEAIPAVRRRIMDAFTAYHAGYRLQAFLHEIYGAAERDKMLALGWRLETDYATFPPTAQESRLPPEAPFLMSIRREDALDNEFHTFYSLFNPGTPRMFFRPAEQALLRQALLGESDARIARLLSISLATVHKRWRAIYQHVMEHDPALLPETTGAARGAEKRTRLLRYLQSHPEELRPLMRPARAGKGSPDDPARRPPESTPPSSSPTHAKPALCGSRPAPVENPVS